MTTKAGPDPIDARLLVALARDPRASAIALAAQTGVSRNTVQARLNKWDQSGALLAFDRRVNPAFLGYPMRAFIRARLKQRLLSQVSDALAEIPEVVEVLGLSGGADLLIQVVARDADDLYRIAGQILSIRGVRRTNTSLVMRELVDHRLIQLLGG
ncbi:Lrp/AsnC family transcriptional regulator [Mycolicibacterium stellerae]|uniref:Lrp/AsnC family transcriptional regulator n=1 Tax=Mycolicibacterium stellerae TaxID=2358193 RepID=UPI000F0B4F72|nr:Lrp/AsnC family transcriptional regulator [Mycolicibacterium stellerae]